MHVLGQWIYFGLGAYLIQFLWAAIIFLPGSSLPEALSSLHFIAFIAFGASAAVTHAAWAYPLFAGVVTSFFLKKRHHQSALIYLGLSMIGVLVCWAMLSFFAAQFAPENAASTASKKFASSWVHNSETFLQIIETKARS